MPGLTAPGGSVEKWRMGQPDQPLSTPHYQHIHCNLNVHVAHVHAHIIRKAFNSGEVNKLAYISAPVPAKVQKWL